MKRLEDLTPDEVADTIIEEYERQYVKEYCSTELKCIALAIMDSRRIREELRLAQIYAYEWIFKNKPQGWKVVKGKLCYKRILTLHNRVKVLLLPSWLRFELLVSSTKFKELSRDVEVE